MTDATRDMQSFRDETVTNLVAAYTMMSERLDDLAERLAVLEQGHVETEPTPMSRTEVANTVFELLSRALPPGQARERANNIAAALSGVTIK